MNKILLDDIMSVKSTIYLMTHSTNPLISEKLSEAINKFKTIICENEYDLLFSVTKTQERFYRSDASPINQP